MDNKIIKIDDNYEKEIIMCDNKVFSVCIYKNKTIRHCENGPALTLYSTHTGNIIGIVYYINDMRHKEDGPACITYNDDGEFSSNRYFFNGEDVTKRYLKFKSKVISSKLIKSQKNILNLYALKIICNENKQQEYVDLIDSILLMKKIN